MSGNGTMMQYFEWYLPSGMLWKQLKKEAPELASAGITGVWIPPCYKGNSGAEDVGYAVYDLYDLGEFDQRGSVPTKYGTLKELLAAIRACHGNGLQVYADIVLDHRMGGDEAEEAMAKEYKPDNREEQVGERSRKIEAYTHFRFPGRNQKYSDFEWHWNHFIAVDHDAKRDDNGVFKFHGKEWQKNVVLQDYMESYLYYSFSTDEPDRHIRKPRELFFEQEVAHLHKAVEALKKYEKKEWQQVIPGTGEYPELLHFKTQKEYVREMPASQIALTADRETFVDIHDLPAGHEFFDWQKKVDGKTRNVSNHEVAEEYIGKNGRDYRSEEAENPVPALQDRKADNTEIGRIR